MGYLKNTIEQDSKINIFKLQELIEYKNKLLKEAEQYYAWASVNFDDQEESKELAISNKLTKVAQDLDKIIANLNKL